MSQDWTLSPHGTYLRYGGTHGYNICSFDVFGGPKEELDEIKRLILAAPYLLAACEMLVDDPGLTASANEVIKGAIAKAKGTT